MVKPNKAYPTCNAWIRDLAKNAAEQFYQNHEWSEQTYNKFKDCYSKEERNAHPDSTFARSGRSKHADSSNSEKEYHDNDLRSSNDYLIYSKLGYRIYHDKPHVQQMAVREAAEGIKGFFESFSKCYMDPKYKHIASQSEPYTAFQDFINPQSSFETNHGITDLKGMYKCINQENQLLFQANRHPFEAIYFIKGDPKLIPESIKYCIEASKESPLAQLYVCEKSNFVKLAGLVDVEDKRFILHNFENMSENPNHDEL